MKIQQLGYCFITFLSIFVLSACSDNATDTTDDNALTHAEKHIDTSYVCPMHPKIIKSEPGNCPICGMHLVKKEITKEHQKKHNDPNYVCPMHPKIIKNEPGSCPICGMHLVKKEVTKEHTKKKNNDSTQSYPVINLTPDVVQKLGVRTTKVKRTNLSKRIKTVGYVTYNERRLKTIRVGTAGWVENLSVRRVGMPVSKGKLLLELYSPEFLRVQKEFIKAQKKDKSNIQHKYAQRQESVSAREHLRYMSVSDSMMNQIARRGKPKHRLPIYAPMLGTVVQHYIHKHQYVYENQPMMVVADLSTVWVEANVYEHQLQWIKLGLKSEIEVKALPGKRFGAQLTYIYPELDSRTRTMKIRLLVPNPEQLLKPNMFAEVRITAEPKEKILTIPREALIITGERESVVLDLGDGKYKPVDVVTGIRSQGQVEIISGLKQNANVVTSGQFLIDSEANLQASFERLNSN